MHGFSIFWISIWCAQYLAVLVLITWKSPKTAMFWACLKNPGIARGNPGPCLSYYWLCDGSGVSSFADCHWRHSGEEEEEARLPHAVVLFQEERQITSTTASASVWLIVSAEDRRCLNVLRSWLCRVYAIHCMSSCWCLTLLVHVLDATKSVCLSVGTVSHWCGFWSLLCDIRLIGTVYYCTGAQLFVPWAKSGPRRLVIQPATTIIQKIDIWNYILANYLFTLLLTCFWTCFKWQANVSSFRREHITKLGKVCRTLAVQWMSSGYHH